MEQALRANWSVPPTPPLSSPAAPGNQQKQHFAEGSAPFGATSTSNDFSFAFLAPPQPRPTHATAAPYSAPQIASTPNTSRKTEYHAHTPSAATAGEGGDEHAASAMLTARREGFA